MVPFGNKQYIIDDHRQVVVPQKDEPYFCDFYTCADVDLQASVKGTFAYSTGLPTTMT